MFKTRDEKRDHVYRNYEIWDGEDGDRHMYMCTVCGQGHEDEPENAVSCCTSDCEEDLEEQRQDFLFDQKRE